MKDYKSYSKEQLMLELHEVTLENETIKKEQKEFQDSLRKRIDEIKEMKPVKRFFAYGRLLWDLISTIEQSLS